MKEIEKMKAGLEYCYDDEEISLMKLKAIENANIFNSLDEDDLEKQHEVLTDILGSVGEKVKSTSTFLHPAITIANAIQIITIFFIF